MKPRLIFLIITFVLSMAWAQAANVKSLYQAELPVVSQSDKAKDEAIQAGFIQVLIKLTGDPTIASQPYIKPRLQQASNYVEEYNFITPNFSDTEYVMQIRYNKEEIKQMLKKAGIGYWGENRPLILLWLSVTKEDKTEMLDNENAGPLLYSIQQQSKRFGLPLILPVMDVQDMNYFPDNRVMDIASADIANASKRYGADAWLIGSLMLAKNGSSEGEWELIMGKNQWHFKTADQSLDLMAANIFRLVNVTLAKQFIVKMNNFSLTTIHLEVNHISDRNELNDLLRYLKQLTPVQQIDLQQVSGDAVQITVLIRGTIDAFEENAEIGDRMLFKSKDPSHNKLIYEWMH